MNLTTAGVYRRHPATSNQSASSIPTYLRSSCVACPCGENGTCGAMAILGGEENDMLIDAKMNLEDGRRL